MNHPTIAIVGRPNVGKSSLLNRIVGENHAIVDPTPGVTRDRNYALGMWNGRCFHLVDTGGLDPDNRSSVQEAIDQQVDFALREAQAIILLLDGRDGLLTDDGMILKLLRRKCSDRPIFACVNKLDNAEREDGLTDFYALGIDKLYAISALHGHGVADLLDDLVAGFPVTKEVPGEKELRSERIALVGKPNVGKSALFNKLLGADRSIVDNVPGTTRDAITVEMQFNGKTYRFIDTAGLRRPARNKDNVERFSVSRTLNAVAKSDIVILMLDASEGRISEQDKRIAARILEVGSACIIIWNKWDLIPNKATTWKELEKQTRTEFNLMEFAPILACSAQTGLRVEKVFEMIDEVRESCQHIIPRERLSEILRDALLIQPPPADRGRPLFIRSLQQLHQAGVIFKVDCSNPPALHFSYRRYLLNQIRQEFPYLGWPVRMIVGAIEKKTSTHKKSRKSGTKRD
jgi:GTP-binding protein